jgi:Fur family transcriptional regulator, ferric uptake regulator
MTALEALCEKRGVRLTLKQRTICRALTESGDHPDVRRIFARAAEIDPRISRGTVYRTMNTLRNAGVLLQRHFDERRARYEEALVDHHHLIDTGSGEVIEFRSEEIEALNQRIARELGYRLTGLRLEIYGTPDPMGATPVRSAAPGAPVTRTSSSRACPGTANGVVASSKRGVGDGPAGA